MTDAALIQAAATQVAEAHGDRRRAGGSFSPIRNDVFVDHKSCNSVVTVQCVVLRPFNGDSPPIRLWNRRSAHDWLPAVCNPDSCDTSYMAILNRRMIDLCDQQR